MPRTNYSSPTQKVNSTKPFNIDSAVTSENKFQYPSFRRVGLIFTLKPCPVLNSNNRSKLTLLAYQV